MPVELPSSLCLVNVGVASERSRTSDVENKGSEKPFATSEKRTNFSQAANGFERCLSHSSGVEETGSP